MVQSILARLDPDDILFEPQPYIFSAEALQPDYYCALADAYPAFETVAGSGPHENNKAYLMQARDVLDNPAVPEIWREFFAYHTSEAFFRETVAFWRDGLAREFPDLEARFGKPVDEVSVGLRHRGKQKNPANLEADVMMDCQFGVNSPVTAPKSVRGPHVDDVWKLFAALLYFRLPEDEAEGSDLILYRAKDGGYVQDGRRDIDERYVEPYRTVPYRPNTLIAYLNTPKSIHGVSPRAVTQIPRRYVNFQCECYRLTTPGFFTPRRSAWGRIGTALRRAVRRRDA
jgi:hypothetical protein